MGEVILKLTLMQCKDYTPLNFTANTLKVCACVCVFPSVFHSDLRFHSNTLNYESLSKSVVRDCVCVCVCVCV